MKRYLEFPQNEYDKRYKRLIDEGKKNGVEAFIFTDEYNIRFFSGGPLTDCYDIRNDFIILIIPTDENEDPALVLSLSRWAAAIQTSWIEDIRFWEATVNAPGENSVKNLIIKTLEDKKIGNSKVAMEVGMSEGLFMPVQMFKEIKDNFPKMEIVSAHEYVMETRKIKSELEIEVIKDSCNITTLAIEKGFENIKEGVSEKHISRIIKEEMFKLGADDIGFLTVIAGFDGRGIAWDSHATDYQIKKSDVIQVDGGCKVKGYCSDMIRIASLGRVKKEKYLEHYMAAREAHYTARDCLKPGAKIAEIFNKGNNYFVDNGYGELLVFGVGQMGHGIGLDVHEAPFLESKSKEKLEKGMTISIEPAILEKPKMEESSYYAILENNYVITDSGYENLSKSSEDIRII